MEFMNYEILNLDGQVLGWDTHFVLTVWKIYGFTGLTMFTSRWFVQLYASRKAGRPVLNRMFWVLSLLGSLILLTYAFLGPKQDFVFVLSYLFPSVVAAYNLYLDVRYHKTHGVSAPK